MSTAAQREVNRQLRPLRAEWKGWASGQLVPWGMPWCSAHCGESGCEGCATVEWVKGHLDRLKARAAEVTS